MHSKIYQPFDFHVLIKHTIQRKVTRNLNFELSNQRENFVI
jgi:hypothetical protein